MRAAYLRKKELIQVLLNHKADVNAKDAGGRNPLHHAAWALQSGADMNPIAELLLEAGADVNAKTRMQNPSPMDRLGAPIPQNLQHCSANMALSMMCHART